MSDFSSVIKGVRLSEKSSLQSEVARQYVFNVCPSANKIQIKQAIEATFGKKVLRVNTSTVRGKARRQRTVQAGRTSEGKKAVVTLAPGESLDLA
jgi:large subunit ribosomal protein L23